MTPRSTRPYCLVAILVSFAQLSHSYSDTTIHPVGSYSGIDNLCGITSLYIVLSRWGEDVDHDSIAESIPPSVYGSSMEQLRDFMSAREYFVAPIETNATSLRSVLEWNPSAQAIVNLTDHWAVVLLGEGEFLQIIDYPTKYHISPGSLDAQWTRDVLLVSPVEIILAKSESGKTLALSIAIAIAIGFSVLTAARLIGKSKQTDTL